MVGASVIVFVAAAAAAADDDDDDDDDDANEKQVLQCFVSFYLFITVTCHVYREYYVSVI